MSKSLNQNPEYTENMMSLLQKNKLFSGLDRDVCEAIIPHLQTLHLNKNEILFNQGDVSDSLYILTEGQLRGMLVTSRGKKKIVGIIEHGETVGELGVLSHQLRSLTIQATVDSQLLKFSHTEFEKLCHEHPEFVAKIIDLVIMRSQRTLKLMARKKVYQHTAIINGDDSPLFDTFIKKLQENFQQDKKFIFVTEKQSDKLLSMIESQEETRKSVIFVLQKKHLEAENILSKFNHIGSLYIVVDGDKLNQINDFAKVMLERNTTPFANQYELVLLHDDKVEWPTNTTHWLQQSHFTLHHHLRINDNTGYQRLLRFMEGRPLGVVLGGGGVKGWVSLGVLKAILENHIQIDAIGGTSAGSALAACYAINLSFEKTLECYQEIANAMVKSTKWHQFSWPIISILSGNHTTRILQETFEHKKIENLWIPYFSMSSNLNRKIEIMDREGLIWEAVRASGAIPGIVPPVVKNGEIFFDGGLMNNLPVDHMREILGENANIIAVSLMNKDDIVNHYNFPTVVPFHVGLLSKLRLGYKQYQFPPFLNTFIQALLLGASAKEKKNQSKADILICPELSHFRSFDFKELWRQNMIDIGHDEMIKQLSKLKLHK